MEHKFKIGDIVFDIWGYFKRHGCGEVVDIEETDDERVLCKIKFEDHHDILSFHQNNLKSYDEYAYENYLDKIDDRIIFLTEGANNGS